MNKIFVVTMYRYGDYQKHSYVLGVYSTYYLTILNAYAEVSYRGQKYFPCIELITVDAESDTERTNIQLVYSECR